jgi:hypothetical protein
VHPALWLVIGAGVAGLVALALLISRVRSLGRRLGSFECALRRSGKSSWASGIASYGVDRLEWYRVLSYAPRPERSWPRSRIEVLDRASRLTAGRRTSIIELRCRSVDDEFTLAMSEQAYAGLTSWLEAAPPSGYRALR